jgi:2-dehydro-3-deoxyphosphooctonate aldolase (KDO 8-P synthase)
LPYVFKASFDKANRTSIDSFRGPGLEEGLEVLAAVREEIGVPVLTDFHEPGQAEPVAQVADVLQVPAFLCRQTDLLVAAARTGRPVNIKKGQFMAPGDMAASAGKLEASGCNSILLTERGTTFGYHNLVVDMRGIPEMQQTGYPVIFDVTHSVQRPAAQGTCSGGDRELAPTLARAAVAAGANGVFIETHPEPDNALCDASTMLATADVPLLLERLKAIREIVREG